MFKILKPEIKEIFDKMCISNASNDDYVRQEFESRNLKLQDIWQVTLCFRQNGKVNVFGHISTESNSCEIAIMKSLIQSQIVNNPDNFIEKNSIEGY